MVLSFLGKYREGALLFLRVGLGIIFLIHGLAMMSGGHDHWMNWKSITANWHSIGSMAMPAIGMKSYLTAWGAAATLTEFLGSILLIIGFCFRPTCLLLSIVMLVAMNMHLKHHDSFNSITSHAASMAIVFIALTFMGAGRYSVDKN